MDDEDDNEGENNSDNEDDDENNDNKVDGVNSIEFTVANETDNIISNDNKYVNIMQDGNVPKH